MSCRDLYGAKLEIGDRVIGVISTTSGVSGTITNIIEDDSVSYITLSDDNGNVIAKNVESRCFTTDERVELVDLLNCKYYWNSWNKW